NRLAHDLFADRVERQSQRQSLTSMDQDETIALRRQRRLDRLHVANRATAKQSLGGEQGLLLDRTQPLLRHARYCEPCCEHSLRVTGSQHAEVSIVSTDTLLHDPLPQVHA